MPVSRNPASQLHDSSTARLSFRPVSGAAALSAVVLSAMLGACQQSSDDPVPEVSEAAAPQVAMLEEAEPAAASSIMGGDSLGRVLQAQPAEAQARFAYRHPRETLEFFGITPGMSVLEALPGGGWYTKILVPYLGSDGTLIGVDYSASMFPLFGFMSEEQLKAKESWVNDWIAEATGWFEGERAAIDAFQFGEMSERFAGEVDAVLLIRALHNLARFEAQGGYLSTALNDAVAALKPGGVVGVVQHMAPEDAPDEWADGSAGYLKKSFVIERLEAAGLELVAESPINENPMDTPTTDDIVWRLPPSLSTSRDDPEAAARYQAIGESNRMTLLFRKAG